MKLEVAQRYLGLFLILAAGYGLSRFFSTLRVLSVPVRLGYGYLLGIAFTGGSLFALSHWLGVPLNRGSVLLIVGPPAALGIFEAFRPRRSVQPLRHKRPLALYLFAGAAAVISTALLVQAGSVPLTDWDGRMTWSTQARYMSAAETVDAPVLQDARSFLSHPRYPPLLPLCQVASTALGPSTVEWDERSFRPLYAAFFPALLLVIFESSRRWVGTPGAAWTALAAALVPFFAFGGEGGAVSAYSDLPLACFWGAGLLLLLRARLRPSDGVAGGIFLAAALLTKNEGAPLVVFALGLAAWQIFGRRRHGPEIPFAPLTLALIPLAVALGLLYSWRRAIPNRYDELYLRGLHPVELLSQSAARLKLLVPMMLAKMSSFENWSLLWWVMPILLLAGCRGLLRPPAARVALAFLGPLAIGWAAYAKHWDPAYLVDVTWDRMLLQSAVPLFVTLAFAVRSAFSQFRRPQPP